MPNALSRLTSANRDYSRQDGELNILYTNTEAYNYIATLIELSPEFRSKLITGYLADKGWSNIINQIL